MPLHVLLVRGFDCNPCDLCTLQRWNFPKHPHVKEIRLRNAVCFWRGSESCPWDSLQLVRRYTMLQNLHLSTEPNSPADSMIFPIFPSFVSPSCAACSWATVERGLKANHWSKVSGSTSYQPCQKRHLPPKMPKTSVLSTCTSSKNLVFWQRPKKSHEVSLLCRYSGAYFQKKIVQNPVTSCSRLQQWKVPW